MNQNLSWLGGQLSLYPPIKSDGSLNIVSEISAVNSRLIQLLLMRQGEDPLHPTLGFAPDLFAPKTTQDPYLYSFQLSKLLGQWNDLAKIGMESYDVRVYDPPTGSVLDIQIKYTPIITRREQLLTYGFWEYVEAFVDNNIANYLASVRFSDK